MYKHSHSFLTQYLNHEQTPEEKKTTHTSMMVALDCSILSFICCLILCFLVSGALCWCCLFFLLLCFLGFTSSVERKREIVVILCH